MDLNEFKAANYKNSQVRSAVPEVCRSEPCILGVDEAGRGPVLGPMVYGVCFCPKSREDDLKALGCADSKTLTEEQREQLFEKLSQNSDYIGWMLDVISPNFICNSMYRRFKCSLNQVSHDSAIGLIKAVVSAGVQVMEVYVDTVGVPEKYQDKLSGVFPDIKVTVEKKADAVFPIVSAASICAKVARDRAVSEWKFVEDIELDGTSWGSGYPNDPVTKRFLSENVDPVFGFPQLVRFSWSTAERILETKAVQVTWEEEEEEAQTTTTPSVLAYFARQPNQQKPVRKHQFFTDRQLTQLESL